jgi:hypothetical protein
VHEEIEGALDVYRRIIVDLAECLRNQMWHSHEDHQEDSAMWQADTNLEKEVS